MARVAAATSRANVSYLIYPRPLFHVTFEPHPRDRLDRARRIPLGSVIRQDKCLHPPPVRLRHQTHQILSQTRQRLLNSIVRLKLLYRVSITPARLQERARDCEVGWEGPFEVELLTDRRHLRPGVEHVRDAIALQYLAMQIGH